MYDQLVGEVMKLIGILLIFAVCTALFASVEVRGADLYEAVGYIKTIDAEKGIVVIEKASYDLGNPRTGDVLELHIAPYTGVFVIEPESEENKNVEKGEPVTALWKGGSIFSSSDAHELPQEKIDQIVENFSEGDRVEVQYDENFVLGVLTKYPQEWTILGDGCFTIVKEE